MTQGQFLFLTITLFLLLTSTMRLLLSYYLIASALLSAGTVLSSAADATEVETKEDNVDEKAAQLPPTPSELWIVPEEFLTACTEGDTAGVQAFLKANPDFVNGRSADGETCLHVAGMYFVLFCELGGFFSFGKLFYGGLLKTI